MLLSLLLAGCADPSFCPTSAELQRAMRRKEDEVEASLNVNPPGSDAFVQVTLHRYRRMTGVYCGEPFQGATRTLNCKFTLHYRHQRRFFVATLAIDKGDWVIRDTLSVPKKPVIALGEDWHCGPFLSSFPRG
jgi:hypothetical protein